MSEAPSPLGLGTVVSYPGPNGVRVEVCLVVNQTHVATLVVKNIGAATLLSAPTDVCPDRAPPFRALSSLGSVRPDHYDHSIIWDGAPDRLVSSVRFSPKSKHFVL